MVVNSTDETNFLHALLLTDKQVTNLCKAFANNSAMRAVPAAANIKLSKTKILK